MERRSWRRESCHEGNSPSPRPSPQGTSLPTSLSCEKCICTCTSISCVFYRWMHNKYASSSTAFNDSDWTAAEFAKAQLPDGRHCKRLRMIVKAFAQKPTAPIPQACEGWSQAKAAYRFLENEAIEPGAIRQSHHQATLQRVRAHRLVLAIQDTSALNYSTHPGTAGLGPIGSHSPKTIGLLLHSTLAVTPSG